MKLLKIIDHVIKHVKNAQEEEMNMLIIVWNVILVICLDQEIILIIIV